MSAATEHLRNKRYLSLDLQAQKDAYATTDRDSPRPTIWSVTQEQGGSEGIFRCISIYYGIHFKLKEVTVHLLFSFTCDAGKSNAETFLSVDPYSGQVSTSRF
jgi:hypothetical protein